MSKTYRKPLYEHYASGLGRRTAQSKSERPPLFGRVRRHLPNPDARVLELGSGDGTFLGMLLEEGFRNVAGVDGSPEQVGRAGEAGVNVQLGDALPTLAALGGSTVDAVVALDVIEHLTKSEAFDLLEQVARVLTPGGRCIIHTVNAASPFFGAVRYGDFTHETAFTPDSIRQVLTTLGFTSVACYEDTPIVHGVPSLVRALAWPLVRGVMTAALAVETGALSWSRILSQNFLTVATR